MIQCIAYFEASRYHSRNHIFYRQNFLTSKFQNQEHSLFIKSFQTCRVQWCFWGKKKKIQKIQVTYILVHTKSLSPEFYHSEWNMSNSEGFHSLFFVLDLCLQLEFKRLSNNNLFPKFTGLLEAKNIQFFIFLKFLYQIESGS